MPDDRWASPSDANRSERVDDGHDQYFDAWGVNLGHRAMRAGKTNLSDGAGELDLRVWTVRSGM